MDNNQLFYNHDDVFSSNNSLSNSNDNYTNNVSFNNLVNTSVKSNSQIPITSDNGVSKSTKNNDQDNIVINSFIPQTIIHNDHDTCNDIVIKNKCDKSRIDELKKKAQNNNPVIFSDGLDDDISYRKGIRYFFKL